MFRSIFVFLLFFVKHILLQPISALLLAPVSSSAVRSLVNRLLRARSISVVSAPRRVVPVQSAPSFLLYSEKRALSWEEKGRGGEPVPRQCCSFMLSSPYSRAPGHPPPPSPRRLLTCETASPQPRGCWQTVNKADYFAACNFYLFLRTYVSLTLRSRQGH